MSASVTQMKMETKSVANERLFDPMAVTWSEKYSDTFEKYWSRVPSYFGNIIVCLAVFILGSSIRGEWIFIAVQIVKSYHNGSDTAPASNASRPTVPAQPGPLADYYLDGLGYYWVMATSISYILYFGIGGFLHWYFYVRQRDRAAEWKCQPNKFLSPDLERHEIMVGSFTLFLGSTVSSILACYTMNGGYSTLYYNIEDYGWVWYILSWPCTYILTDYITYWFHRLYHRPFLYKKFHKLHHKYKQPTAFSVTAIHPVEFLHQQCVQFSPMFLLPVHWSVFATLLMYLYYHGIIDHSGINFKAQWWQPWQPDCIFHDNHHQYFHVNFGFNCELWDKLHGTYRQKDKVYREDIFYGKGKSLDECTKEELTADLNERVSENVLAYRGNTCDDQIKEVQKKLQ